MQILPIYLYNNSFDVILDLDPYVRGANNIMYQRDLKIQKGLKNQIRIQFKNSDQKKVRIYNTQTFVFSMFDSVNQRLLIEKNLEVLDNNTTSTRGIALLTLNESETIDLDTSRYQFSIKLTDSDGTYTPAYANTYYGMAGTLELSQDIYPPLQPSTEITGFQKSFNGDTGLYEHKSGNIEAKPQFQGNSALHTMAFYLNNYRGQIHVQGTLYNSPGQTGRYATILSRTYTGFNGIDYVNFNGVYSYVRVMYIPATKPGESDNDNPTYWGAVDKVLYRS
jgi:hypothetical protein